MQHKAYPVAEFKAVDKEQGIFEALVSVFDNIDRAGDRVKKGAFTKTLGHWQAKGRPIPVIFAHQWDNLDAHIGEVLEAKETDEGLYVKAQLYMDEAFARKVFDRMDRRTLAEFSFAYDVVQSKWIDNGEGVKPRYVTELTELELLEVGPCLFGMNPATELISVRGLKAALADGQPDALQELHDMLVELGASCRGLQPCSHVDTPGGNEDGAKAEAGDGKAEEPSSSEADGAEGKAAQDAAQWLLAHGIED